MCDKTKDLGRTTFGIAIMFGIYWMYSYFLEEYIPIADSLKSLLGLVVLYVIGLGVFVLITKKVSVQKYEKKKISLSNFFGSIIIQSLLNISMIVAGIYSMLLMLSGVIGLIMFIVNKKKVVIDGEPFFIKKGTMKEIFSNKGIWFYMALTLIVMIIK
ncbi:MAG: hypothetical protein K2M60_01270 [Lachnospiraceae bacterium]|nr:hypothetical protein [Lachnospiraceae bacterium]MDE6252798.1 hypothetical protein [Lachnospiraceae bacterium]